MHLPNILEHCPTLQVDVVGKTLEGEGGDMNTEEADDEDIKSVMAACTGSSPTKRSLKTRQVCLSKCSLTFRHIH